MRLTEPKHVLETGLLFHNTISEFIIEYRGIIPKVIQEIIYADWLCQSFNPRPKP